MTQNWGKILKQRLKIEVKFWSNDLKLRQNFEAMTQNWGKVMTHNQSNASWI